MEKKSTKPHEISSTEAVFVGALAPGVNGATWNTMKMVFVMLGLSLIFILILGFTSSDFGIVFHVSLLVFITFTLFFLLARYSFPSPSFVYVSFHLYVLRAGE